MRLEQHLVFTCQGSGDVPSHLPREFLYLLPGSLFVGCFSFVSGVRGWVSSEAIYNIEFDPGYPSFTLSSFFDLDVSKEVFDVVGAIIALSVVRVVVDGGIVIYVSSFAFVRID